MVCTVLLAVALVGGTSWLAAAYTRAHPLDMAPYVPRIEKFLAGQGLNIRFGGLELFYDEGLVLRADGIQLLGRDDTLGVYVEKAAVRLANRNIWRLQAAPKSIEAQNVTLRILRKTNQIQVAGFEVDTQKPSTASVGSRDVVDWLNNLGTDGNLWGRLKDVRVSGLTLLVRDDVQNAEWVLENGSMNFSSYEDVGARGSTSALIRRLYGGREIGVIPVLVTLEHTPGEATALVRARFDQTDVAMVADYLPPKLQDFIKARGQIDLSTELGADNRIGVPLVTLRLADVSVLPPAGYNEPFHFRRLVLAASYAPSPSDVLTIRQVDALTKGGMAFWGRGRVANVSSDPYLDLALGSPGGSIMRIYEFFPDYDTRNGQPEKWVQWLNQNISDTQVAELKATLRGRLGAFPHCAGECGVSVSAVIPRGAVKFLPHLPPVTGVQGQFYLGKVMYSDGTSGTEVQVRSPGGGMVGGQKAAATEVRVTNLFNPGVGHVVVSTTFSGALSETMAFVNNLDVPHAGQLHEAVVPGVYTGQQNTQLWLDIPMIKGRDARLDEIGMRVSSSVSGVGISGIDDVPGFALAGATGTVRADAGKLNVALAGTFDGQPLKLNIQDNLVMSVISRTANLGIDVNGGLPAAFIMRVLSGTDDVSLSGAVQVKAALRQSQDKNGKYWQFDGTADALGASVGLVPLGWNKPRGTALNVAAKGVFVAAVSGTGGRLDLHSLNAKGSGVDVQGKLNVPFDALYASSAALHPFILGRTNANVDWQNGALKITGKALDVSGEDLFESSSKPKPAMNMELALELGALYMKNGRLDNVNARLDAARGVWNITRFVAQVDGEHVVNVAETPLANGGRRLGLSMTNVGRTLAVLGLYDKLRGGTMAGDITYSTADTGKGTLFMDNFELLNPPLLVRLLGLMSLQQLVAGTDSVLFDKARIPVVIKGDVVQLNQVVASGPSLSMRLNGDYNRAAKNLDIDGSMAPAIPFNRLVSKVPILGTLLTGSQDGLVVADFSLKGAVADPEISVQPLSVLTPGLLKDLFRMGSGR